MKNELKAIFDIDHRHLDREWLRQAGLVYEQSELLAEAEREIDRLSLERDVTYAELDEMIRVEEGKKTEVQIKQWVVRHERYKVVENKYIEATYNANILKGVMRGLEHKKKALERLVDLMLSNYYSDPRNPVKDDMVGGAIADKLKANPRIRRAHGGE